MISGDSFSRVSVTHPRESGHFQTAQSKSALASPNESRYSGPYSLATPLGTLRGFGFVSACFACLFIDRFPQFSAYLLYALLFKSLALHITIALSTYGSRPTTDNRNPATMSRTTGESCQPSRVDHLRSSPLHGETCCDQRPFIPSTHPVRQASSANLRGQVTCGLHPPSMARERHRMIGCTSLYKTPRIYQRSSVPHTCPNMFTLAHTCKLRGHAGHRRRVMHGLMLSRELLSSLFPYTLTGKGLGTETPYEAKDKNN
ncbi:hypothetical protein CRG98_012491 [Punica granatum]|uniref:Uncharacterized protein n=1 Tax=Punica granatum TaxID=22663 RepID=A0A2I0KF45_PUNGR|nr:hypothetical protein CRG98_012491 [Punica granatum]